MPLYAGVEPYLACPEESAMPRSVMGDTCKHPLRTPELLRTVEVWAFGIKKEKTQTHQILGSNVLVLTRGEVWDLFLSLQLTFKVESLVPFLQMGILFRESIPGGLEALSFPGPPSFPLLPPQLLQLLCLARTCQAHPCASTFVPALPPCLECSPH